LSCLSCRQVCLLLGENRSAYRHQSTDDRANKTSRRLS
jgi:hypothetical protein